MAPWFSENANSIAAERESDSRLRPLPLIYSDGPHGFALGYELVSFLKIELGRNDFPLHPAPVE
jgi:hypothetical protein